MDRSSETEQKRKKIDEYSERHRFWATQASSQFGYSINLFTTIGIAFLAYLVELKKEIGAINIDIQYSIDCRTASFVISLIFAFLVLS